MKMTAMKFKIPKIKINQNFSAKKVFSFEFYRDFIESIFSLEKGKTTNVIISASDDDGSDENGEQTLYDKPLLTAKSRLESPSIKRRALKVPVQDGNGSPMLYVNGQSPTTTDHSVA